MWILNYIIAPRALKIVGNLARQSLAANWDYARLTCLRSLVIRRLKNQRNEQVVDNVAASIQRLHTARGGERCVIGASVEVQVELRSNFMREEVVSLCHDILRSDDLMPRLNSYATHAVALSILDDASEQVDLPQVAKVFNQNDALNHCELQVIALRHLVNSYWRRSDFSKASQAFTLMADSLDRQPSAKGLWHLCNVAATICNDERQHTLARRFSMQALSYAWSLEEDSLIQRAQYDHANSMSLLLEDPQTVDGFAELRGLVESGRAQIDQVTSLSVLIGSARDFMRMGETAQAIRCLESVEERSSELNTDGLYLLLAAQVRLAHLRDQTLVRDSKLEEIHWMQSQFPSRLGEQARSHVCFQMAGQVRSYRAMDGGSSLLPEEIRQGLTDIGNRCRASAQLLENTGLSQALAQSY